jgi:hypothetical protein
MTTAQTTTNPTDAAFGRLAEGLLDAIAGMAEARYEYAVAHGMNVTDEEVIASVRASLLRMLAD